MIGQIAAREAVKVLLNQLGRRIVFVFVEPGVQFVQGFFLGDLEGDDYFWQVVARELGINHGVLAERTLRRGILTSGHGLGSTIWTNKGLDFGKILHDSIVV